MKTLEECEMAIIFDTETDLNREYTNLFHYTDEEATGYIVDKKNNLSFRFSQTDTFTDKNEMIHVFEPYKHICGKLYNQGNIDAGFYRIINNEESCDIARDLQKPWILCVTPNGNSQYMKERYAPADGFIIGFQSLAFQDLEIDIRDNSTIYVCRVFYSQEEMESKFQKYLMELYEAYNQDGREVECKNRLLLRAINNLLFQYSICYKGEEFKDEEEIRMVVYPKYGFYEWYSSNKKLHLYFCKKEKDIKEKLYLDMASGYYYNVFH